MVARYLDVHQGQSEQSQNPSLGGAERRKV